MDPENSLRGGPNSKKGSLTENFNMAKINNLAIPGGGGGGGVRTPSPPLYPPMKEVHVCVNNKSLPHSIGSASTKTT